MPDETLHPGHGSTAKEDLARASQQQALLASGATMVPNSPEGTLVPGDPAAAVAVRADPEIRAQLPSALGPSDVTLHAPDTQAYHQAALAAPPVKAPGGTNFGDYELIEPIAKGGMGIVYKARQRKLNRVVAIKMILDGQFADQSDIDRFYAEAEAAAALSHPNIVAIHEVGEWSGQHFFSMDFIDGESLAHLVHENPLRPRRAAEFVKIIAETVQFAHDNGVVHRDLKPANILLDKRQRPLITDFGLAKQVSSQSQRTIAGSIVGTPSYMPPEQAAGRVDEIGPWSDLYSLGAILYELLTGRPPFRSASPFETIRQVLETEPLSPRLLNENVPKDLETICLKCLQKDRHRRYPSCHELAEELGRFLLGEPIQARPISRLERSWRLVKRNPITSAAIAAAAMFFVAASIISTIAYFRTSAALESESVARIESDRSFREALAAVNDLFTTVSEDTLLNQPGMQPLREQLLKKPLEYYQRFLAQRGGDPRVQDELGSAYYRVGQITEALRSADDALVSYESARKIQQAQVDREPNDPARSEALGNTLNALGTYWVRKRDFAKAASEYGAAAKIRQSLADRDPDNSESQRALANTLMNMGMAEYKQQHWESARERYEQSQKIRAAALAKNPAQPRIAKDSAIANYNLANVDVEEGKSAAAEQHYQQAIAILEQLTEDKQPGLDYFDIESRLAIFCRMLADLLPDEQAQQRRQYYQKALSRLEPLAAQNPAVAQFQTERAGVYLNLFQLELLAGNADQAQHALERARSSYQSIIERNPDELWVQRDLAVTLRELAKLQDASGHKLEARSSLEDAIQILKKLVAQKPDQPEFAEALADAQAVAISP